MTDYTIEYSLVTDLQELGFTINILKSTLEPSHQTVYLGLLVDSETKKLRLPEEKVQVISTDCSQTLAKDVITAQRLASVISRLSAARPAVLPGPLHLRHLQHQLIQTLKASGSFKSPVTLNQHSRDKLTWWIHQLY